MDHETREILLKYLGMAIDKKFDKVEDLALLTSKELLELTEQIRDEALPLVMQLFKETGPDSDIFNKLMGDHDEDNREASERFFSRYEAVMMQLMDEEVNPIIVYLPQESWVDLAFLQSRENFFLRQTMADILDFFSCYFEEIPDFMPGDEKLAWNWFFNKAILG